MIELKNISKSFGKHNVINNVSATFEKGKVNFIIGRSGSGKSVLTKCTVGLLEPDEGHVFYDGRDFTAMNRRQRKEIRKEIGMLFQGGALFDSMTVEENIKFPLKMFSDMDDEAMSSRVADCLTRVELEGHGDKYPGELSGGMQKRVGIARAISMNPKYLFCDEPNSGLDPQTAIVIDNLIVDITREYGMTTVVVSHDMNSVIEASDTIHFIHEGEIAFKGDNAEMMVSDSETLNDFIYASKLMRKLRDKAK
ncbi:MAG TPA: ATP-binding cassette domain-containing protein [Flavobacteriales bacterium]|nr:ATP-binding cassette domain-containing protein [Flavobacteriales bacterium]HHZ94401.1 ATP-binding cassette domain-containing protein [Flavobacteriales bacterium]HIB78457.1 ATP-binding cassette domain-containing protein [Flavobacteriales bacterium]HIN41852.1 ATP-binding cassette domain-containing protein [Flavobacteriales bacterium]HIO15250.1 ATP-binding cassette domain-containing protein [Flavobacteriales bacterium]